MELQNINFNNDLSQFTFSEQCRIWSFHIVVLQRMAKKCTQNQNFHALSTIVLPIKLQFSDITVAVVVFLDSLNDCIFPPLIQIGLFANITLTSVPGLARLLLEGETLNDLMALSPEEILLRWFNYHLAQAGHHRRVKNFSDDIHVSYHIYVHVASWLVHLPLR